MGLLPRDLEDKLMPKVLKYPTWQSVHMYIKERHEGARELEIARSIHAKKPGSGRVYAMNEMPEQQPPAQPIVGPSNQELADMIAAMRDQRGKGNGKGDRSADSGAKRKFMFRGCWQCGVEGHNRAQCSEWLAVLDKNGKPPPGHKGAKDKAYDAWKAKRGTSKTGKGGGKGGKGGRRDHVKALGGDSENTEDEDDFWSESESDGGDTDRCFAFTEVRTGTPWKDALLSDPSSGSRSEPNAFSALREDDPPGLEDDQSDAEVHDARDLKCLKRFAHSVNRGGKQTQAQRKAQRAQAAISKQARSPVTVRSDSDFNNPAVRDMVKALPKGRKELEKLIKLCPREAEELLPGEIWVLGDTGSTKHGLNVKKEIPGYSHLVRPMPEKKRGTAAETAGGDQVMFDGEIDLTGTIDGELHTIPFVDMKVSMPIASMRRTVKQGNDLIITEDGGIIRNRRTKKVIRLHERQGLYFFKMKLLPPQEQVQKPDSSQMRASGFGRQA